MKTKALIFSLFFVIVLILGFFINNTNAYFGAVVLETDEDSFIESGTESGNTHDTFSYISSGYPYHITKGLIKFNITDLINAYQYGYFDDDVHLRFYYHSTSSDDHVFDWRIYRIIEDWDVTTVTWDNAPNVTSMLYNYTITKSELWDTYEYCYLDIQADFQQVLEENVDFYGYMIYCSGFTTNWQVQFPAESTGSNMGAIVYGYDEDEEEEGEYGMVTGDFLVNWFIYAIFLLVIPIGMTAYISNLGENPSSTLMLVTFLGSETLMSAISLSIGLISIWFMLVVIIVDILLILGLMKR